MMMMMMMMMMRIWTSGVHKDRLMASYTTLNPTPSGVVSLCVVPFRSSSKIWPYLVVRRRVHKATWWGWGWWWWWEFFCRAKKESCVEEVYTGGKDALDRLHHRCDAVMNDMLSDAVMSRHGISGGGVRCDGLSGPCASIQSDAELIKMKARWPSSVPPPWHNKSLWLGNEVCLMIDGDVNTEEENLHAICKMTASFDEKELFYLIWMIQSLCKSWDAACMDMSVCRGSCVCQMFFFFGYCNIFVQFQHLVLDGPCTIFPNPQIKTCLWQQSVCFSHWNFAQSAS